MFIILLVFLVELIVSFDPPVMGQGSQLAVGQVRVIQVLQQDEFGSVSIGERPDGSLVIVESGQPAKIRRELWMKVSGDPRSFTLPILYDSPEFNYVVTGPLRASVLQTMQELGLPKLSPMVAITIIQQVKDAMMYMHGTERLFGLGISPDRIRKCPFTVSSDACGRIYPLCLQDLGHAKRQPSTGFVNHSPANSCWDPMFCSVRSHLSQTQSKEQLIADDWESLMYTFIYLLQGELPWQYMSSPSEIMQAKLAVNQEIFDRLGTEKYQAYKLLHQVREVKPGQNLNHEKLFQFQPRILEPPRVGDIVGRHWLVEDTLGAGSFGYVLKARNSAGFVVALKYARVMHAILDTVSEFRGYRGLLDNRVKGVPNVFSGEEEAYFEGILAMEMKGPSLMNIARLKGYTPRRMGLEYDAFKLETLVYLGHQLFSIIEAVHKAGFVHGDIKPENLVMGSPNTPEACQLFMIDFSRLAYTPRYCEALSSETVRVDSKPGRDLESAIYTLIELGLPMKVPWDHDSPTDPGTSSSLMESRDKKLRLTEEDLHPLPRQFLDLLHMSRWLAKDDVEIDYQKFHAVLDQALGGRKVRKCQRELIKLDSSNNLDLARFTSSGIPPPDRSGIPAIWFDTHNRVIVSVYSGKSAETFSHLSRLGCKGLPKLVARGLDPEQQFIAVSQHHQTSLAVLLGESGGIDLVQLVKIGHQLVNNLESLHKVGYVAGLFSPWDLMWAQGRLYFSNFEHMHLYVRSTSGEHLPFEKINRIELKADEHFEDFGPVLYQSTSYQCSRRSDLESAVYILAYLGNGTLPWMDLNTIAGEVFLEKLQYSETKFDPLPPGFFELWKYARELGHAEQPNYEMFHNILNEMVPMNS